MNLIITGPRGSGKTTLCEKYVANQLGCGKTVAGILTPRLIKDSETMGYETYDILTGESKLFAFRKTATIKEAHVVGPYIFNPDAIAFAEKALQDALISDIDIIAIDEYGELEMNGNGIASVAAAVIFSSRDAVVVVQEYLVGEFLRRFASQRFGILVASEYIIA